MPRYQYLCSECQKEHEVLHSINDLKKDHFCKCGNKLKKLVSIPVLIGFDNLGRSQKE